MATTTSSSSRSRSTARKPQDRKPAEKADVSVTAKKRGKINVKLVGESYSATPPKAIISMKFARVAQEAGEDVQAMVDALFEWLDLTFEEKQSQQIQDRLYDPKDDIDFPHIVELMQKLTEQTSANPTT